MAAVNGGRLAQLREQAPRLLKKYRLPLLIFLAGLILAAWPAGKKQETKSVPVEAVSGFDLDATTSQLEQLLSGIAGAGRVRLMLTLSGSETTLYQTDSRTVTSAGSTTTQTETVFRQTGSSEKEPARSRSCIRSIRARSSSATGQTAQACGLPSSRLSRA